MNNRIACFLILCCGIGLSQTTVQAQGRTGTASGGTGSATAGGGGQQRGGSAAGPSVGGGGGQTGQGDQAINAAAGTSESINREFGDGFIGRSDTAGTFVGNENAGPQRLNQQTPNFQQRQTGNVQGGKPTRESKVRPVIRIAFPVPGLSSPASSEAVETEMIRSEPVLTQRMNRNTQFAGIAISRLSPNRLALDGVVSSERDRKLAEMYLRLEPGVREIDNRLMVVPGEK